MKARRLFVQSLLLTLLGAAAVLVATCTPAPGLQYQVRQLGTLRVAMVNSATTYYLRGDTATGFEYDLVRSFAADLGLQLEIIPVSDQRTAIAAVTSGKAHLAAGVAINPLDQQRVHFTPPYAQLALDIVYNAATDAPENMAGLDGRLTVQAHGALGHALAELHPGLAFSEQPDTSPEALMARVANGELYSTIANADLVAINQRYYPNLRVAFTLEQTERHLAWAFPTERSTALFNQAIAWLAQAQDSGQIAILRQRYFGNMEQFGFVGGRIFAKQVDQLLPQWRALFERTARRHDLDWRLLAAISYQESHWDADAVSPTGVRGLMMLTEVTAAELGLSDRRDPQQSVSGGTRYLLQLHARLPDTIEEPDRTWMALAAYNIGLGHVLDARRLLEANERDPTRWANVREALGWLTKKQYYSHTRHGYAPGYEAVKYVDNIRIYYDILLWMSGDQEGKKPAALQDEPAASTADADEEAVISIDSPAL